MTENIAIQRPPSFTILSFLDILVYQKNSIEKGIKIKFGNVNMSCLTFLKYLLNAVIITL